MEINELMQPANASALQTTQSKQQLPDASIFALGRLMQQARDYYPNQTLPEGTPDMYLRAWEEIAQEQGMNRFEAGLWKALRSNTFFPTPDVIEKACEAIRASSVNPSAAIDAINARYDHFKAHPEMYETTAEVAEMAKKINERFGMERPKVIDTTPVMMNCPHCSQELPVGPNIRFWTVQELRTYADVLESNQASREVVNG